MENVIMGPDTRKSKEICGEDDLDSFSDLVDLLIKCVESMNLPVYRHTVTIVCCIDFLSSHLPTAAIGNVDFLQAGESDK